MRFLKESRELYVGVLLDFTIYINVHIASNFRNDKCVILLRTPKNFAWSRKVYCLKKLMKYFFFKILCRIQWYKSLFIICLDLRIRTILILRSKWHLETWFMKSTHGASMIVSAMPKKIFSATNHCVFGMNRIAYKICISQRFGVGFGFLRPGKN